MENEIYNKECEDKLLELIFSSISSNNNLLLHRYYIDLLTIGKMFLFRK